MPPERAAGPSARGRSGAVAQGEQQVGEKVGDETGCREPPEGARGEEEGIEQHPRAEALAGAQGEQRGRCDLQTGGCEAFGDADQSFCSSFALQGL
jgi:hypothetical protein